MRASVIATLICSIVFLLNFAGCDSEAQKPQPSSHSQEGQAMEYGLAYVDGDGEVWLGLFKDGKIDEFSSIDVEEKDFVSGLLPTEFAIIKIESKGADSTFAKLGTLKLQHNGKSEAIYKQDKEQILKLANAFYPTVRQKVDEKYSS